MMSLIIDWFIPLLTDTFIKGSVVISLALALVYIFQKGTAALKHSILTVALISLVLFPIMTLVVPSWELPVNAPSLDWAIFQSGSHSAQAESGAAPLMEELDEEIATLGTASKTYPGKNTNAKVPVSVWIAVIWLAGALLSLAPFFAGFLVIRRFKQTAAPVDDPSLQALISELGLRIGLKRKVRTLVSGAVKIPTMYGILRPQILLPADLDEWPRTKQEAVLLHELGHVKRMDCLSQALARLGLTLQWFNPLAWYAARRMLFEREKACDDLVLRHGSRASEYADFLLEIVRTAGHASPAYSAALTMARKSQFEGRFLAILDSRLDRASLSRGRRSALLAIALIVMLPLAGLRCTQFDAHESTAPEKTAKEPQSWEGWPQYRGRPDHNNYRDVEDRIRSPHVLWKTTWASVPAVVDDDVYAGGESLRLIDLHSGETKASWKPVGSEEDFKVLGTPVVLHDRVIVHTTASKVHALDRGLTQELWSGEVKGVHHFSGVCDKGIFVMPAGRELVAFDTKTGERKWNQKYSRLYSIQMTPAIADDKVLFGLPSTVFYALDLQTGEELWYHEGDREFAWTDPVVVDGRIFVGDRGGVVNALSLEDGSKLWSWKSGVTGLSEPGVFPGWIVVGFSKFVASFEQATGNQDPSERSFKTNFNPFGSPTRVGKTLYFGNLDGHLYAFDYKTQRMRWCFATNNDSQVSDFVYHKDILLVSTTEGLYAIGNHPEMKPCKYGFVLKYDEESKDS